MFSYSETVVYSPSSVMLPHGRSLRVEVMDRWTYAMSGVRHHFIRLKVYSVHVGSRDHWYASFEIFRSLTCPYLIAHPFVFLHDHISAYYGTFYNGGLPLTCLFFINIYHNSVH